MTLFADIVTLSRSRIADPLTAGIKRFVGLEHIEPENLHISRWGNVADGTTFTNRFKPGQVLFGKRRAYQRKVAVADFEGVCSGDIYVFESKDPEKLLPELLPFICQSEGFYEYAVRTSAGSLSPRTNWKHLAEYEFPLPPIDEQRRIADLLWASDRMTESLIELSQKAEKQYFSILTHVFENGSKSSKQEEHKHFKYPAHWNIHRLDELYEFQLGKMSSKKSREGKNQKQYVKNNNVLWGEFNFSNLSSMSFDEREQKKFSLKEGDLLVCEGGEIGRAAIWKDEYPNLYYQKAIHRLRAKSDQASTELLFHYLRLCSMRGILLSIATGTTILHLPEVQLAALKLPFPEKQEQKEILTILNNAWNATKTIEARVVQDRERHKKFISSTLQG